MSIISAFPSIRVVEVPVEKVPEIEGRTALEAISKNEFVKISRIIEVEDPPRGKAWLVDVANKLRVWK